MELEERGCGSFRVREAGPLAPPVTVFMRTPVPVTITAVCGIESGVTGILSFPRIIPTDVGISLNN